MDFEDFYFGCEFVFDRFFFSISIFFSYLLVIVFRFWIFFLPFMVVFGSFLREREEKEW